MNLNVAKSNFEKSLKPLAIEEFLDYYFYRRLAQQLVPYLIKFGISPNQITSLSLAFGLVASWFLYHQLFVSSVLFALIAIVFDCCDGQVARLTGQTSPLGRVMDGFYDLVWLSAFWVALLLSGYFQQNGLNWIFPLMVVSSASNIIHCWRFDGVKIKYLEMIDPSKSEGDLDVSTAFELAKSELKKFNIFAVLLCLILMFQMYFFVRGKHDKKQFNMSSKQISDCRKSLEPIINQWSYLGEGHHNSILLLGVLIAVFSPWGLVGAFISMAVPMNIWWLTCEVRWAKNYHACLKMCQETV